MASIGLAQQVLASALVFAGGGRSYQHIEWESEMERIN